MASLTNVFSEKERANWLKAWLAVVITKSGLEQFSENEAKTVHANIYNNVWLSNQAPAACTGCHTANLLKCPTPGICKRGAHNTCRTMHDSAEKQPRPCPSNVCNKVRDEIVKQHKFANPSWKNTTAKKWANHPWQIAKAYLPPDGYAEEVSVQDTNFIGIISFMMNCKHFENKLSFPIALGKPHPPCLLTKARESFRVVRHSSTRKITDTELLDIFTTFISLLTDPACLAHDAGAQEAVRKLEELQNESSKITTDSFIYSLEAIQNSLKITTEAARDTHKAAYMYIANEAVDEFWMNIKERKKALYEHSSEAHLFTIVDSLADKTLDQLPKYLDQCLKAFNAHMDEHSSKTVDSPYEKSCKGPRIEALSSYFDESKHRSYNVLLVMKQAATDEHWTFFTKACEDKYKCDGDIFETNLDSFVVYVPARAPDDPDDLNVSDTTNDLKGSVSNDEVHGVLNGPGNSTEVQDFNDAVGNIVVQVDFDNANTDTEYNVGLNDEVSNTEVHVGLKSPLSTTKVKDDLNDPVSNTDVHKNVYGLVSRTAVQDGLNGHVIKTEFHGNLNGPVSYTEIKGDINGVVTNDEVQNDLNCAASDNEDQNDLNGIVNNNVVQNYLNGEVNNTGVDDYLNGTVIKTEVQDDLNGSVSNTDLQDYFNGSVSSTKVHIDFNNQVNNTEFTDLLDSPVSNTEVQDGSNISVTKPCDIDVVNISNSNLRVPISADVTNPQTETQTDVCASVSNHSADENYNHKLIYDKWFLFGTCLFMISILFRHVKKSI
ncbi:uncharacterized protein DDB_G0273453/DDB_G0273565-like [Dreissena polymorpha]|uniref:Uncharacterized protein n=1 Tax=Dreissena polymorpha TaxID=45954 RepID=A0A9D4L368_DREPO|nr:uncharacterized protein DDB_G0273453/DDB_G0273565-like [Dreissena polymorpha]XP_052274803.1 uncharacterized protein DDB_G0273453/DDB_G0273565-like [Dreissena polymorpha]XP_052274804.1 uncharacterized protein DDB_G0273453/DDB_G0273565-like [Dreissena polymorpha]KAH3850429.1 hypothetical protein DPMN_092840 [Dreissena polymorpha]